MTRHHAKKYLRAAALVAALIFSGNVLALSTLTTIYSFTGAKLAPPSGGGACTETVLADLPKGAQSPTDSIVVFRNGLLSGTTFYLGAHDVGSAFTLVP